MYLSLAPTVLRASGMAQAAALLVLVTYCGHCRVHPGPESMQQKMGVLEDATRHHITYDIVLTLKILSTKSRSGSMPAALAWPFECGCGCAASLVPSKARQENEKKKEGDDPPPSDCR